MLACLYKQTHQIFNSPGLMNAWLVMIIRLAAFHNLQSYTPTLLTRLVIVLLLSTFIANSCRLNKTQFICPHTNVSFSHLGASSRTLAHTHTHAHAN